MIQTITRIADYGIHVYMLKIRTPFCFSSCFYSQVNCWLSGQTITKQSHNAVRMANRKDSDQTASSWSRPFQQATSFRNFRASTDLYQIHVLYGAIELRKSCADPESFVNLLAL